MHKFTHQKPRGQDEHLEAIYEEFSLSRKENNFQPTKTVKDYLKVILNHTETISRQHSATKESESFDLNWALGALAIVSFIFLFNGFAGSGDWAWLDNHRFAIRLWGIAFAAVFLGVSIERTSFFKSLWAFGFTKVTASVAVSALIVFSTGKASGIINSVFPVDASALPFTRAIVAGLLMFQYSYPLLFVVGLFSIAHAFSAIDWIKYNFFSIGSYKAPPTLSAVFLVFSIVILVFFARLVNTDFSQDVWPKKAYQLAHILDFNSKYECQNLPKNLSVVFLGPDQARVLVDVNRTQTDNIESFVDGSKSAQVPIPKKFYILPCNIVAP
ncbi:hypothetical protein [Janthinobacterium sp. JC611]|uniref:hypothetical protein n=1 Tax=Janthinobacterium sp. JC611 TaxID=2816201 RepID=UPI001BFEB7D1|nr:hypothetical protein [Janthinobacterium sp. JC611]